MYGIEIRASIARFAILVAVEATSEDSADAGNCFDDGNAADVGMAAASRVRMGPAGNRTSDTSDILALAAAEEAFVRMASPSGACREDIQRAAFLPSQNLAPNKEIISQGSVFTQT